MKPVLALIALFFSINVFGQNLILKKKGSSNNEKVLKLNRDFLIKTEDTTYYYSKILIVTDSTLVIQKNEWSSDLIIIPIKHIQSISRPWLKAKNPLVVMGGALLAVSAPIFIIAAPIEWAANGKDEGLDLLKDGGYLAGTGIALALIGSINRKYDLTKHWKIKNKN